MNKNLEDLQYAVTHGEVPKGSRFNYPPNIAKTIGFKLISISEANAELELEVDIDRLANPMGTLHGGVIGDIADSAIGTAHVTTIEEGASFTSVDLQINFFRPVFNGKIRAKAYPVNLGKTISRYTCDVLNEENKLIAQVQSTVMTLRGEKAKGR